MSALVATAIMLLLLPIRGVLRATQVKDSGILLDKNGKFTPVFDYKDNWKP